MVPRIGESVVFHMENMTHVGKVLEVHHIKECRREYLDSPQVGTIVTLELEKKTVQSLLQKVLGTSNEV